MTIVCRREFLVSAAATVVAAGARGRAESTTAKPMRGAFMILHTPFSADGAVDWEDLAREAIFVDRCGCQGVVWPQGSSRVATLTTDERLRGMEVLASAMRGKRAALVLGVQGKDTADMLEYARKAEALAPDAMIAMPPTSGQSMDDYHQYFRGLAQVTKRPVIVQTSGGNRGLAPSTELIVELASEFPNFGYVKEETAPIVERMKEELRHRPPMKGIFGASLGVGWLYEMRLGLDGIITGNAMFADLMARIWDLHERGRVDEVRDAYARFLLMRNLEEQIPDASLYIMKKRGIFKTTTIRTGAPAVGASPKVAQRALSPDAIAEIEYRFAGLKPYLDSF
ncbi:MAG TPA: dihydrodipicolinate synthase family protein [Vicinamibacterales bacterium]|jgi:4-hydroxy-tetrahydrodipicolinate synthase|nr:dihydrodipicolinate synthase family protein [Vicinamibacterales bacterium]